tara:strand:- start:4638 stop:5228 length:591 start_codon:yes stop_codon:yes gene_type:complete
LSAALPSWSRRRAAVAAESKAQALAQEQAVLDQEHAALCEKSDEEILDALGLPDPDSLVQGDDFKAFLSKTVPAHLRKRALRTLWRSNPVLACVDGLNDYDDDYLTGSIGQDPIKTTYQVGQGMLAHLCGTAHQKQVPATQNMSGGASREITDPDVDIASVTAAPDAAAPIEDPSPEAPEMPRARRMQFHFEGGAA